MECLNQSSDHTLANLLEDGDGYVESDCDEQLIMRFGFQQNVKLHSLRIKAPSDGVWWPRQPLTRH